MKKCPFCKSEIELSATNCPICKRVLIEKVDVVQSNPNRAYSSPPLKESKEQKRTYYTNYKTSSSSEKQFQFPKIGGGLLFSIIGSIVLTIVLNYHGSSNYSSNSLPAPVPAQTNAELAPISIPQPIPQIPYYPLPNGRVFYASASLDGEGILTVSNGSSSDAVVKLITNSGRKVYSVYIRANNSYSIKNINDGIYRVVFAFGQNWDVNQNKFLVNPSASAFDDSLNFETSNGRYTTYEITLNAVIDGNAKTTTIDPSLFDKY